MELERIIRHAEFEIEHQIINCAIEPLAFHIQQGYIDQALHCNATNPFPN